MQSKHFSYHAKILVLLNYLSVDDEGVCPSQWHRITQFSCAKNTKKERLAISLADFNKKAGLFSHVYIKSGRA